MENLKFRITSPEQSERLQKILFELGYKWDLVEPNKMCNTDKSWLYIYENGRITWDYTYSNFVIHNNEERDTEAFIAQHTFVEVELPKRNKYSRQIKQDVWVDVYDVLEAFKVTSPTLQHLTKKALCAGLRGHKDERQDLVDILDSAKRALEMYDSRIQEDV